MNFVCFIYEFSKNLQHNAKQLLINCSLIMLETVLVMMCCHDRHKDQYRSLCLNFALKIPVCVLLL